MPGATSDSLADVKGEAGPGSTQLQPRAERARSCFPRLKNTRALYTAPDGTPGLEIDFLVPVCPCYTLF